MWYIMDYNGVSTAIADPPLLTGGLTTPNVHLNALNGVSVDYLTITIPASQAEIMLEGTNSDQPGYAKDGFKQSEQRTTPLGVVFRRFEPRVASKAHGYEYESWLFPGPQAATGVDLAKSIPGSKPSRIDFAFDFSVDLTTTSDDVLESFRDHFEGKRLTDGISGQGGINTRYIGSASSLRRVRIYRKDLEDQAYAKLHGPTVRVELVLKGEHAEYLWHRYTEHGEDVATSVAVSHLYDLAGLRLKGSGDLPGLVPVAASAPAEKLAMWVQQNGATLVALCDAGIDLKKLCDMHAANQNRQAKYRRKRRENEIRHAGTKSVEHLAELIIKGVEVDASA